MSEVTWTQVVDLFGYGILAGLIAGAVCPLVGCLLFVRRTSFYGLALPQFAAAGVACGFVAMPWWIDHVGIGDLDLEQAMGDSHAAMNYHLAWAVLFTFGGLLSLAWLNRRGGSEINRVAAAFALATAATVLFAHSSVFGEVYVHELLQGMILAIDRHQLEMVAVLFGAILLLFLVFHRDFLLVSFDRETARAMKKRVLPLETLLVVVFGLCVSIGTMTVGPMILFGLLVLPPLAARHWARSMTGFYVLSSALGVAAVLLGVFASLRLDWPTGPTVVAAAGLELVPGIGTRRRSG